VKKPIRFLLFFISAVAILSAGVYLYYLPVPKDAEEKDYKDIVRRISFDTAESLDEWDEKRLSRHSTDYFVESIDGRGVLKAVSEKGASGLYLKETLSFRDRPYVKWSWRALKFPERKEKENFASKEEFDMAAQFYVLFQSRMMLNAKAIQYVWAHEIPEGAVASNPYTDNVKIMVLQTGESGEWKAEERDIAADYEKLFGTELDKDVAAIALMTDADSTGTRAEAYFADIEIGYLPVTGTGVPEEQ
jgi:hypothetical protein